MTDPVAGMTDEEVSIPLDELPAYIEGLFADIAAKDAEIERLKEEVELLKSPPWKRGVLEASSRATNSEPRPVAEGGEG